jgi:hypothetical protein
MHICMLVALQSVSGAYDPALGLGKREMEKPGLASQNQQNQGILHCDAIYIEVDKSTRREGRVGRLKSLVALLMMKSTSVPLTL